VAHRRLERRATFLPLAAKKKGRSCPGEKKGRRHPEALAEEARCGG
jgi:hypothetical protein